MKELKAALKHLALYYFLLVPGILLTANTIPDRFPTRNLSVIYLLTVCVGLVFYYSHRVPRGSGISVMMQALAWMGLLLILLRGIKYSVFAQVGVLTRHTWYLYYVPMLLLPLFLFVTALLVSPTEDWRLPRGRYLVLAVTVAFIVLVLTNDWHQWVFRFAPGFENWDSEYTYGKLFYALTAWQYLLYAAAIVILLVKCRISSAKKLAWIILIPVATGIAMNVLLAVGKMPKLNGTNIIEFPEAYVFTAVAVLECCIQLGLIPTNAEYGKLFRQFSIAAQITDKEGNPVYASFAAQPLSAEQFALESGARIGAHTVLHKMEIPGGFGFWQDDMAELDRLNAELAQAKEKLAQEAELIRLHSQLKQKQLQIEQRTHVYDTIAGRTQKQSQAITLLAQKALQAEDVCAKAAYRGKITLLGAYIKRYANLMLLSQESNTIEVGELGLSVAEVLRYLNYCGIPGEFFGSAEGSVRADAALKAFEAFETLLETNLNSLQGVFVNLSAQQTITFKVTLENLRVPLSPILVRELATAGVAAQSDKEDEVTYICFTLPGGGEALC